MEEFGERDEHVDAEVRVYIEKRKVLLTNVQAINDGASLGSDRRNMACAVEII